MNLTKTVSSHEDLSNLAPNPGFSGLTIPPALAMIAGLFTAFAMDFLDYWVNWLVSLPLYYYAVICSHDALHGSAHRNKSWNQRFGAMATAIFILPFSMIRRAHLSHHSRPGKLDDIERFAYVPGWTLFLRWVFGNIMYFGYLPKCTKIEKLKACLFLMVVAMLLAAWPKTLALGWLLPMQTTVFIFAVTTIYLPHGPQAKWVDRNIPFVTGYHEDHHVQPRYPWHQISQRRIRLAGEALVAQRSFLERAVPKVNNTTALNSME